MLLKKQKKIQADAVVAFADLSAAEAMANQLDEALGSGNWHATEHKDGQAAIHSVASEGGEFLIIGVTSETEDEVSTARELIADAKLSGLKVILLADMLPPTVMHSLMRAGADDFAPLPLPAEALGESIRRLRSDNQAPCGGSPSRIGSGFAALGAAGGVLSLIHI